MQSHDITPISEAQIQSIVGVKLPIVDAYLSPDDKAMVIIPLGEIAIALLVAAKYEESKLWKPTLKRASAVSAMSTVHFPISAGAYTSEAINS
jgi:hypothetical protein